MLLEAFQAAEYLRRQIKTTFPTVCQISNPLICRMNALPQSFPAGLLQEHFTFPMQPNHQSCKHLIPLEELADSQLVNNEYHS